jgi:LAT3 family solute carrier family 43 protein 3
MPTHPDFIILLPHIFTIMEQYMPHRIRVLVVAVLTNLLAGGFVFGFSSLLVILKQENTFMWLCTNFTNQTSNSMEPCIEQELALARVFLAGNICAIGATLPMGMLMDYFNPKVTAMTSFFLMFSGSVSFAVSSQDLDLFAVGFGLMGFAAPGCIMSTFHTTSLFPINKGLVMAIVNAAYDSSSIMCLLFLGLYLIIPNTSLIHLFLGYGIGILIPLAGIYIWVMPTQRIEEDENQDENHDENQDAVVVKETVDVATKKISSPLVSQEVLSMKWFLFTMFFSVNLLRFSYYLGSVGPSLVLTDANTANIYLSNLGIILPLGFLASPAVGYCIDYLTQSNSILLVFSLGLLHTVSMCIPSLPVQILTFILFTLFRALFFSIATTFAVKNFTPSLVGRVFG